MGAHLEIRLATSSSVQGMRDSAPPPPPAPSVSATSYSVVEGRARRGVTHRSWGGPRITSQFLKEVVNWTREKPKIDVFAAGRQAMCPRSCGRRTDAFEQSWWAEMLFLLPPEHCYRRVIDKIILEGARGILLVPVTKEASWYRAIGELAVDWWGVPADTPIFADSQGCAVYGEGHRQWRVVLFHAAEPEDHCSVPRRHRRAVKHWDKLRDNRYIRAVIEADREDPCCRVFRWKSEQEYSDVLEFKPPSEAPYQGPDDGARIVEKPHARPPKVVPNRCVGLRAAAFKALFDKFQSRGMLREAVNPQWICRAFVVPKPGGRWRLVIYYGHLNSQIKKFMFPLPYIEDKILEEGKKVIWSIFDLEDGFRQMPLEESSRKYTALITQWGVFEWPVLPMGLKTAPVQYQRMVQWCLEQDKTIGAKPNIDDVLAGTPGPPPEPVSVPPDPQNPSDVVTELQYSVLQAHDVELRRVFDIFRLYKLTVKREKMFLFQTRVKFCGHVLEHGTRLSAPDKRAAIERWEHTHIVTPAHSEAFHGLAHQYALYMKNYAMHAAILSEALAGLESNKSPENKSGRRHKVKLTPAMIQAFHAIKESMVQEAMLHIPDLSKHYEPETDTSDYAVGAVLYQRDRHGNLRPVPSSSRKL